MNPRVSIIMPAYNAGNFIAESINSVLNQTFEDWELIVIDDGSTDSTAEVVRDYAQRDERLRLLQQSNDGQASARNAGLGQAHGSLIAFLDADDLWVKEKLELQVAAIEREAVDLVFSCGWMFRNGDSSRTLQPFTSIDGRFAGDDFLKLMLIDNRIPILSVLVRRNTLTVACGFNEDRRFQHCEDCELWLRLIKQGVSFYGMSQPLFYYRVHSKSAMSQTVKWHRAMIATIREHGDSPCLDEELRREKYFRLYRGLTLGLIAAGESAEARKSLAEMAKLKPLRGRFYLLALFLRILPRQSRRFYQSWLALKRMLGLLPSDKVVASSNPTN